MIILPAPPGLLVTRQPDHAEMSASIAREWLRPDAIPPSMWPRFIEAVRRHDDGWIDAERAPLLDAGGSPHDFRSLPAEAHDAVWLSSVALASAVDPYAGILVALHARWLSGRSGERDPERFIRDLEAAMEPAAALLRSGTEDERAASGPSALLEGQRLLTFFDGLSLAILGATPRAPRTGPLSRAGGASSLALSFSGENVRVHPWPFRAPSVPFSVPRMHLPQSTFRSPGHFLGEILAAPPEPLEGELLPA